MAARFVAADAAIQAPSPEDVGVAWIELQRDSARMKRMGDAALRLVDESRGATERALDEIKIVLAKNGVETRG
jgi:3-deoxy-D-manno-octulosonic-acid transferase